MRPSPASPKTHLEAPRLLHQVRDKIRLKHYSIRTEQAYTAAFVKVVVASTVFIMPLPRGATSVGLDSA